LKFFTYLSFNLAVYWAIEYVFEIYLVPHQNVFDGLLLFSSLLMERRNKKITFFKMLLIEQRGKRNMTHDFYFPLPQLYQHTTLLNIYRNHLST